MEARLIALKLFLKELGVELDISKFGDRIRIQKSVYLGQLSGVDLGYRYNWYIRGPYCPSLTRDYYELAEALRLEDETYKGKTFRTSIRRRLKAIRPLLKPPEDIGIKKDEWLELVSSIHFLRRESRYSKREAEDFLRKEKPQLALFIEYAESALKSSGFLK
jgi:uncharacterized protein YwgA